MTKKDDKLQAIEATITYVDREFGKGSLMRLGDRSMVQQDVIPTGSLALDAALGVGGIPRGRVTEIYGPEASGKTTLTLHIIAEAQKKDGYAAFIDAEHALDPTYAQKVGID
ncbi:MAG: DNA recombination/repair protein RecA, partial [Candidatus Neomarinimicrobiota bacterium]